MDLTDKSSSETSSEQSPPPDSPEPVDLFGEPLILPRVGDEYQAEIPAILSESERLWLFTNPADCEAANDMSLRFLVGLAVPVMWVSREVKPIKNEVIEGPNTSGNTASTSGSVNSINLTKCQIYVGKEKPTYSFDTLKNFGMRGKYDPVPGLPGESWNNFETDCFLLGLYIFGKSLLQVKRFMESKEMGQLLAYYYGKFYRSDGYQRWSDCRKMRNKKGILGQRIFTGARQHELFSRLLPVLSEESRSTLLEASKAFADGRFSLEEYVSTLKSVVGIRALIEAVGIGKGKDDLTANLTENLKHSHAHHARTDVPSGKACSSLTYDEIIKFLTGGFRLSKARSNDLFWEAVWPRLLARGWHSEQPKNGVYTGPKNGLVFLMPGVTKFSRWKLVKGDHYFDSVTDVLAKISDDPRLLELDTDETRASSSKEENGWAIAANLNDEDPSDHEQHCYLKPRVSTSSSDLVKFTVVDTSLPHGENPDKVRELRSLPVESKSFRVRETDKVLEHKDTDISLASLKNSVSFTHSKGLSYDSGTNQRILCSSSDNSKNAAENCHDLGNNLGIRWRSAEIKHQFSRRIKSGLSNCSAPVIKRRKLGTSLENGVIAPGFSCVLSLPATKKNVIPKERHSQKDSSTSNSTAGKYEEKINPESSCQIHIHSNISQDIDEKPQLKQVIDLNLPQVQADTEPDKQVKIEAEDKMYCQNMNISCVSSDANCVQEKSDASEPLEGSEVAAAPSNDGVSEQQPRRHSTRNRPLTTKALESMEIGFLNPTRQYRKRSPSQAQNPRSKRFRPTFHKDTASADGMASEEKRSFGICYVKKDPLSNPYVKTEKEKAHATVELSKPSSHPEVSL